MKTRNLLLLLITLFTLNQSFSQETEEEPVVIEDIDASEDEYIEDVPFAIIDEVPAFPGCEGSNSQKKHCMNLKIQKHVRKNFNTSLANSLDLSLGYKKIFIQFKITKKGNIEVMNVRAPHIKLKKEAIRIVKLLPKMKAGIQDGKPVNVTYMLPINFYVDGKSKKDKN